MTDPIFKTAKPTPVPEMDPIQTVLDHMKFCRGYTLSLLEGLDEEDWFKQPVPGLTHIAWQVGHIAMSQYGLALFRQRGRAEVDLDLMPSAFRKKFSRGTTPDPDPESNPNPVSLLNTLKKIFEQVQLELPTFSLEELSEEIDPPFAGYSTRYGALLFAVDHEMIHAGQIGLLRRLLGKEPLR